MQEVIVVGAGASGLACARALRDKGVEALVLDKGRGVGGRMATRRVEGQPIDHGLSFFHGSDPSFLDAVESVQTGSLEGWPSRVKGEGKPCRPQAFQPHERRLAFAGGVASFAKSLARGLDVRTSARVDAIEVEDDAFTVVLDCGERFAARKLVLTPPVEQTRKLLEPMAERHEALRPSLAILRMLASEPCLTLLAGYEPGVDAPDWDVLYPGESDVLALVSHDSAKRDRRRYVVLVFQCGTRFSRRYLESEPTMWTELVLAEAGRHVAEWAARPAWTQSHRWRFARVSAADALAAPLWVSLPGRRGLGIAGEAFAPGGGVEGAFLSGRRLASALLGE